MPFFFTSIRTKTAVLFFLVFLLIILPVHWLVYKKVEKALVETTKRELNAEAERLLSQVRLDPVTVPLPAEGFVVKVQVQHLLEFEELFTSPNFPSLEQYNYLLPMTYADTFEILNVRKQIDQADSNVILSLGRSSLAFQQQLNALQLYLFLAIVVAIGFAGMLVYFVSGWILKPIRVITNASVQINLSKDIGRIPIPSTNDESRQLAETLNAMLQRIENSSRIQTNFFASAAHELRTPLAVMKADLTMAGQEGPSERMASLLHEVDRLERVIHDFLLISELKAETLSIRMRPEAIDELIYSAIKKVRYASDEYGTKIQLKINEEASACVIQMDADKMETVIANLIENAIKYSPRQSVVTLRLAKLEDHCTLTICNPTQQVIENPEIFLQEFKKSADLSSGLGMGLWICDQIVKLHGYTLTLSSGEGYFTASLTMKI